MVCSRLWMSLPPIQLPCQNRRPSRRGPRTAPWRRTGVVLGLTDPSAAPRALLPRNTVRLSAAALLLCGTLAAPPARAQGPAERPETGADAPRVVPVAPAPARGSPAEPRPADPSAPPDPVAAMDAFRVVEAWIRDWEMPALAPEAGVPEVPGAAVTLRLRGDDGRVAVIGRGSDLSGRASLWKAARRAWEAANARRPEERDALWLQRTRELAGRTLISVELAGQPVPFEAEALTDATLRLSPGIDGVAARFGDRTAGFFPAEALERGLGPAAALSAVIADVSQQPALALEAPSALRERGFAFLTFRTTHLAQPGEGLAPLFLTRGGRIVPSSEMNTARLVELADGMADFLLDARWPGVERYGLTGTLDPVSGRPESPFAAPGDQAAAALALLAYADARLVDPSRAAEARRAAMGIVRSLSVVEPGETPPWADAGDAALAIAAVLAAPPERIDAEPELSVLLDRCLERVRLGVLPDGSFAPGVDPADHSAVAFALARLERRRPRSIDRGLAEQVIAGLFARTPPGRLVAQMPWLALAEFELAGPGGPLPHADELHALRETVLAAQVRRDDLDDPALADLVGGIVYTAGRTPLPTWNSIPPLTAIGAMLGDPRLTPGSATGGEVPREILRLLPSLRFIDQLSAGEAEAFMHARPERSLHGVRLSLWDQNMPPVVTAHGLLAVAHTLQSLDAISRR